MDATVLAKIIQAIEDALAPGLATLRPFLVFWVSTLILLEALRVYSALLDDGRHARHVAVFLVRTLIGAAVLFGWPAILETWIEDCVGAGLRFGGNFMSVQQFLDPGALIVQGISTAKPLAAIVMANAGLFGAVYFLPFLGAWLLFLGCFVVMAGAVFLVQVEFRVVLPVSLLALGFFFWGPTRSMAAGVLSYSLNIGLRFFMQAILASLVFRLIPLLAPPISAANAFDVSMLQAMGMVFTAALLAYLFIKIPLVVSHHLAGLSTLSPGGALQTAAGLLGMATGATMLLRSGGPAWNLRPPPALPAGGQGRLPAPAPPRAGPPAMPTLQALNTTLRSGAQYLGHEHGGGGPQVTL